MKHALVTGGAGFIGSHLVDSLLADGWRVTVFDNFDPFYDRAIKEANIRAYESDARFALVRGDLRDADVEVRRALAATYLYHIGYTALIAEGLNPEFIRESYDRLRQAIKDRLDVMEAAMNGPAGNA